MRTARIAYFPDSFHEVNGVAHTSRNFVAYARRHHIPMLCVRAGNRERWIEDGTVQALELPRSAAAIAMEQDLSFDPLFWRHADTIEDALRAFQPDILHMTGPSELGIFAAYFAWKLNIPLAASWHTNVHEYAARRLEWLTTVIPGEWGKATGRGIEGSALDVTRRFYGLAGVLFAPNDELCTMLAHATGRPCHLMKRGVDTGLFSPLRRTRNTTTASAENPLLLGFVGRLSIEKNVALLPRLQRELTVMGLPVRFVIVGQGGEEEALRAQLPTSIFRGVLRGTELAEAYADMDLMVFPSHTDTFGNVVLEALASGVPAVVTPDGGPKFIVREAGQGRLQPGGVVDDADFAKMIASILRDAATLSKMRLSAREYALTCSWDAVFDGVYAAYLPLLRDTRAGITTVSSPA